MISYVQAIVLGALQGITELFPISNVGHSVIVPSLLGWNINQSADAFAVFLVATHFATALVLFCFFWKDWVKIFQGPVRSIVFRSIAGDAYAWLGWLIVLPPYRRDFWDLFLKRNWRRFSARRKAPPSFYPKRPFVFCREKIRANRFAGEAVGVDERISKFSWTKSFCVGCAQALALFPDFPAPARALSGGLVIRFSTAKVRLV